MTLELNLEARSTVTSYQITFKTDGGDVTVPAAAGASLLEVAQNADVVIDAPCGGNGTCGKCRLRLLDGNLESEATRALSGADAALGWRLACKSQVSAEATLELPDSSKTWRSGLKVETDANDIAWLKLRAQLEEAGLWERATSDPAPCAALVAGAAPAAAPSIAPLRESAAPASCAASAPHADGGESPYALACDLGTTSVSMLLLEKNSGNVLAQASAGNAQIRYGADVINRIIQQTRPGGIERFQRAIVEETLNPLIASVCRAAGISPNIIDEVTIAGNTTMNHLLLGLPTESIRIEPFVPVFLSIEAQNAAVIGLAVAPFASVHIAPNVGSYVGGDITAGVLASGLWQSEEMTLFIDLGTNGELVLGNNEFMMTCACSAGPAFEGGDIDCGMRATDGAIEAVAFTSTLTSESFEPSLTVIGGGQPSGICGSGLIDLVSELFRTGAIDGKGRFIVEGPRFSRDEYGIGSYSLVPAELSAHGCEIALSEVDIDNFIRAKAAIFSAITIMLEMTGLSVSDISQLLVAGGIGGGIDIDKAVAIGLFPDIERRRFSYLGNASLIGARAMAASPAIRAKVEEIAAAMTYLELSTEPGYMDAFIAASFLPHTNLALFPSLAG